MGWAQLFLAALGGGFTVKLVDILYQEYRHRSTQKKTATEFVDQHLEPLLKAADELVGKLRSLAETDFRTIQKVQIHQVPDHGDYASLIFLFGRFWGQIEIVRHEGMTVALARDKRGAKLQRFFDCLESRRVRFVDRITQRAIGEVFLEAGKAASFVRFVETFEADERFRKWLLPLLSFLSRLKHTTECQKLLQYLVILHALIDTLDQDHMVTRNRPALPAKLSKRSWADLNYRVFKVYLPFVMERTKYIGPPKRVARR